jgi:hypothetical protein
MFITWSENSNSYDTVFISAIGEQSIFHFITGLANTIPLSVMPTSYIFKYMKKQNDLQALSQNVYTFCFAVRGNNRSLHFSAANPNKLYAKSRNED